MLTKLKPHLKNWAAHGKVLVSGAVGAMATGAANAVEQVGLDPVKMVKWAANDWHQLTKIAAIGALVGVYYRVKPSPYTQTAPAPPAPAPPAPPGAGQ